MALPIRPIPDVTGEDAVRFIEAAEAAERNPGTKKLRYPRASYRKMIPMPFPY